MTLVYLAVAWLAGIVLAKMISSVSFLPLGIDHYQEGEVRAAHTHRVLDSYRALSTGLVRADCWGCVLPLANHEAAVWEDLAHRLGKSLVG